MAYRPDETRTYYVAARNIGTNRVFARSDDAPADTTTTLAITPGEVVRNYVMRMTDGPDADTDEDVDVDWVKLEGLVDDTTYRIAYGTGWCFHTSIIEGIYDSSGVRVAGAAGATTEASCGRFNSRTFRPPFGGDYYVALSSKGADKDDPRFQPGSHRKRFVGTYGRLYLWGGKGQLTSDEPAGGDLPTNSVFTTGHVDAGGG